MSACHPLSDLLWGVLIGVFVTLGLAGLLLALGWAWVEAAIRRALRCL